MTVKYAYVSSAAALIFIICLFYSMLNVNVRTSDSEEDNPTINVPLDNLMKGPVILQQDDPLLIQEIKKKHLHPPSKKPYHLLGDDDPSMGQSTEIRKILKEKKNGFYVECGALDGETRSNSLVFEKKFGWDGVLIEGDPKNFNLVKSRHRKAWTINACLSTQPYPNKVLFKQDFNIGRIFSFESEELQDGYAQVQCLPLYSILLALNRTQIDYFSLDVEGDELAILKTIPWEKVDITTLSVEWIHGVGGKQALIDYMIPIGYERYTKINHPGWVVNDLIFIKKDFLHRTSLKKGA